MPEETYILFYIHTNLFNFFLQAFELPRQEEILNELSF